jgi:hypothetical protein
LVEYNPNGNSEFAVEEGYTNNSGEDIPFAAAS